MPSSPAISVVMPVRNRADPVGQAVESVLQQSFSDFELIVVDDASTDRTAEVVESFADPRVRLIRLPSNRGANAARNEGIRQSRGKIICFLDSDDRYLPNKLQTVANVFAAKPGLGAMIDSFVKTYSDGRPAKEYRNPVLDDPEVIMHQLFLRRIEKSTPAIAVTREAALEAGLFDESLRRRQDFDFLIRLLRSTRVATFDTITWVKTSTPDSISADLRNYLSGFMEFWDRHPQYYREPELRRGFAADLTRHFGKLLVRREFALFARDFAAVRQRLGWGAILKTARSGIRELRHLKAERARARSS